MKTNEIFKRKNIVVTGGAGFIGSLLCDELVKENKVICIDNFSSGSEKNINNLTGNPYFEFIKHDLTKSIDLENLQDVAHFDVKFQGVQEIYHLACPTSHSEYKNLEVQTAHANAIATKNALEMAKKYKAKFLHASSSAIYGEPLNEESIPEEYWGFIDPLGERAAYNEGKRFAETLVSIYKKHYNIDAKIARIFNAYGPRMELNSGRMIPDFIRAALKNEPLVIYGDEKTQNTFCYIADLIDAMTRFMKSNQDNYLLNIGNDQMISIEEIAKIIIKKTNSKSNIQYTTPPPFITRPGKPNVSKARKSLGWFPLVSLDEGLKETIKYMRSSSQEVKLNPSDLNG